MIEEQLIELARTRSRALVNYDVDTMKALLADEFVYINASGEALPKADYLRAYMENERVRWELQELDSFEVQVYGSCAVLRFRVHDVGSFKDRPFDEYLRSTFIWVQENGTWRCVSGHTSVMQAMP